MAKLEVIDGKVVITYPEDMYMAEPEEERFPIGPGPEEERRSGIGSLLGAVTGAGQNIATLLGRAGQQRSDDQPNFFRDLFLNRAGGGGKDYMIPDEASTRADLNEVFIIGGNDMKKAEEIEAKRILPSLYDQAMKVVDAAFEIDDEDEKMRIINDINRSFDKTEGTGSSRAANSYYRIIQKYGYLLNKDRMGLPSLPGTEVSGDKLKLALEIAKQRNPGQRITNKDLQEIILMFEDLPSKSMMMDTTTGEGANIFKIKEDEGRTVYPFLVPKAERESLINFLKRAGRSGIRSIEEFGLFPSKREFKTIADELKNMKREEKMVQKADGGRIGYQTGGITEQRTLPPEFVEAAQKTFLTDLSRQAGIPSITTAVQQQPGETAQQFANRQAQAQQFQITRAGMAELAPQVAAQDPLQAAAYQQAVDPTKGLGAFQPFLTAAQTAAGAAAGLTGPMTAAQQTAYTSPFQQQVIDTTLAEFDKQAQMRQNQLAAQTLGVPGAFGGGREGVQRAEFQATSDANRARVLADLRQRGFQQAATARQQDLANQMGIAQLQSGLGGTAQDFARAQISGLGTLGAQQQAQTQAVLDAQRQAAAMAVEDPRRRLSMFGQGISGLTPGAGTVQLMPTEAPAAGPSPLMQALGVGLAGADIYGRIFGGRKTP
jgi:hypothetical protein